MVTIKTVPGGIVQRIGRKAAKGGSGKHVEMKVQAVLLK